MLIQKNLQGVDLSQSEKEIGKVEAIIKSMTKGERKHPNLVSCIASRKKRIANGTGTTVQASK